MDSRFLMTLQVAVVGAQKIGAVPHGTRVTAPITSGHFEGPRLRGKVLPGGGDWTLLRGDGVLELDLRITLETDDGALIHMTSEGIRDRTPEVRILESPPRRIARRSARRRPHLHDRRDPMRRPWKLDEGTFSSLPRSRPSLDALPCRSRLPLHHPPTGELPCDRVP